MFNSSLVLAVLELSAFKERLIDPYSIKSPTNVVPITPEEPTSVALAITAIVAVAAFVGLRRVLRPHRQPKVLSLRKRRTEGTHIDTPTRGAA